MTWRLKIDRAKFLALFDAGNTHIFSVPVLLKYDPAVHNPGNTDYLEFVFEQTPTLREQQLIELALSETVYQGPAVSEPHTSK